MGKRPRSAIVTAVPSAHAPVRGPKMAAHLAALTADGGIPLFTRKVGDVKPLPFSSVGTLNGVHLFARLRGAHLFSTITGTSKIVWKIYHNSIVLLIVTSDDNASDEHLGSLLDNVFAAMVMSVGLDTLQYIRNVERLKRDLRPCFHVVDHLLNQLDQDSLTTGDLTGCVDCLLCPESQALQHYLDVFTDDIDTAYGFLLVKGKVGVATKQWWSLTGQERMLLATFVSTSPKVTSRDIPIYLPTSCPNVCNRLVTLQLTQGVELCLLCGPSPPLSVLEDEVCRYWKESFELLKSASSLHPRNFPSSTCIDKKSHCFPLLDRNILGFILINVQKQKSVCSVQPQEEDMTRLKDGKCVSLRRRQEILRALYRVVVGAYFTPPVKGNAHTASEVFTCGGNHKSYAMQTAMYQIFLLFSPGIPTFTMRAVSRRTLSILTTNKLCAL